MRGDVIASVVSNGFCIGCGLCAAVCPRERLPMRWNRHGELCPDAPTPCPVECGLCLKVCPFAAGNENEDSLAARLYGAVPDICRHKETGYYLAAYVGYSERHRSGSASGGLATWLLEDLLASGVADRAICVAPTGDAEKLFAYRVFSTPEDMRAAAGSTYYPVEMSEVVRQALNTPGRYVVTGLPCFIKAIRLAQQQSAVLRERIVLTVGLVCGQMKSKAFTECVASLAGVRDKVMAVRYRGKSIRQPANNFYFAFRDKNNDERRLFWNDGIADIWSNRWFTPTACNFCDDIFAECADVAFMDAWLPEYSKDPQGTSIALVRSPVVANVFARERDLCIQPIAIERVVQSQPDAVLAKRRMLGWRLRLNEIRNKPSPQKRVAPKNENNPLRRKQALLEETMQFSSKDYWMTHPGDGPGLRRQLQPYLARQRRVKSLLRVLGRPGRNIRRIARRLRGE